MVVTLLSLHAPTVISSSDSIYRWCSLGVACMWASETIVIWKNLRKKRLQPGNVPYMNCELVLGKLIAIFFTNTSVIWPPITWHWVSSYLFLYLSCHPLLAYTCPVILYILPYTCPVILVTQCLRPKEYVCRLQSFSPMLTWRLLRPVHTLRSTWTQRQFF